MKNEEESNHIIPLHHQLQELRLQENLVQSIFSLIIPIMVRENALIYLRKRIIRKKGRGNELSYSRCVFNLNSAPSSSPASPSSTLPRLCPNCEAQVALNSCFRSNWEISCLSSSNIALKNKN